MHSKTIKVTLTNTKSLNKITNNKTLNKYTLKKK
jgi:hypothetical protein